MRKTLLWLVILVITVSMIMAFSFGGCKKAEEVAAPAEEEIEEVVEEVTEEEVVEEAAVETTEGLALELGETTTRGPKGQIPIWYNKISLTEEEKEQVKKMGLAIAYDQLNISNFDDTIGFAIDEYAKELNMKYLWSYNQFDAAIQKENVETLLAANPDIIAAVSVDPVVSTAAFKEASQQGVSIVFCSIPAELAWPDEYTGLVFYDFVGFGPELAKALNEALGGVGNIGYVYHEADFFITNQRDQGFKDALAKYPGLKLVVEAPIGGVAAEVEEVVSAMITKNPEINGIYLPWQELVPPALSALRALDRMDIKVVTNDLGETTALEMIQGDTLIMMTQCDAHQYGRTVLEVGLYPILGKTVPAEAIMVPGYTITRDSLEEVWPIVFNEPLPNDLKAALEARKKADQ